MICCSRQEGVIDRVEGKSFRPSYRYAMKKRTWIVLLLYLAVCTEVVGAFSLQTRRVESKSWKLQAYRAKSGRRGELIDNFNRNQLKRIALSIQRLKSLRKLDDALETPSRLVSVLFQLAEARDKSDLAKASRKLQSLPLLRKDESPSGLEQALLERAIRAACLAQVEDVAWNYTVTGLLDWGLVPGTKVQDSLSKSLRRAGDSNKLESLVTRIGQLTTTPSHSGDKMSLLSFNMFLSTLCLPNVPGQKRSRPSHKGIDSAYSWVTRNRAQRELGLTPDLVSYSTILHAAAMAENRTLADSVWHIVREQFEPDINAFNARLKSILQDTVNEKADQEALELLDNEIVGVVSPDQYTLDHVLPPLIRAGRIGDVEDFLDRFISENSEMIVSNAFSAFLVTLVREGEIPSARALFETYLGPALSSVVRASAGTMRIIKLQPRHFNILLEGMRKVWQNDLTVANWRAETFQTRTAAVDNESNDMYNEAWALYEMMTKASAVRPDGYTITTMMGLCKTSEQLSDVLLDAITHFQVRCKGVVFRAALCEYGRLKDPSSAAWLCIKFGGENVNLRSLNALMGSFVSATGINHKKRLNIQSSVAAQKLSDVVEIPHSHVGGVFEGLEGMMYQEASLSLLTSMVERRRRLPRANSQTFCLAAAVLQHSESNSSVALELFRNASALGVPADGRFVNAIFRCFGSNIQGALSAWRNEIRPACIEYEQRQRKAPSDGNRLAGKNLVAAYNGLMFVCGRALQPGTALRLVYAMRKEGLEANELSLNCYNSGKRKRTQISPKDAEPPWLSRKLRLIDSYESLLYVECMEYDQNDKRRKGEKRVRIIL